MKECLDFDLEDLDFLQSITVWTETGGIYSLRRDIPSEEEWHETRCLDHSVKVKIRRLNGDWDLEEAMWSRWLKVGMQLHIPSGVRRETVTSPIKRIFA